MRKSNHKNAKYFALDHTTNPCQSWDAEAGCGVCVINIYIMLLFMNEGWARWGLCHPGGRLPHPRGQPNVRAGVVSLSDPLFSRESRNMKFYVTSPTF